MVWGKGEREGWRRRWEVVMGRKGMGGEGREGRGGEAYDRGGDVGCVKGKEGMCVLRCGVWW